MLDVTKSLPEDPAELRAFTALLLAEVKSQAVLIRCPATHACMCEREQARGSPKYQCVYLHAWETGSQARAGVGRWITFNNHLRPHAAHGAQPPAVAYYNATESDQKLQAVA